MDDVSTYFSSNRTLFLTCCIFWIFSLADGNFISKMVGSRVMLGCNTSQITVQQLTWQLEGTTLISYLPEVQALYASGKAETLKINMSLSGTELYSLVIDGVQKPHAGNYSCFVTALEGVWEHKWELMITEEREAGKWPKHIYVVVVALTVLCVCCLVFTCTFTVLQKVSKQRAQVNNRPAPVTEHIGPVYENCLEITVGPQGSCHREHYRPTPVRR